MKKFIKLLLPLLLVMTLTPVNMILATINVSVPTDFEAVHFILNIFLGFSWMVVVLSIIAFIPWLVIGLIQQNKKNQ